MEERYEIRGKIGQGGLGAVYRGFDTRMNREVAIKRITTNTADPELQKESTRQLIKEAGALSSLQHPHIVTVYDAGSDEDGPYVVMELISGKTLDELLEQAPLTWPDFRELALQTQEALIAAQDLDLIHSDIKPSNLMLTWLPSGKFQVKILDFGLAKLAQSQSIDDLKAMDAVFGSVFFMAPEQFERSPLDARSDLYSMGCVYYQALTGSYPFDGASGNEVMESHLAHQVTPIQHIRSDIPLWACDWIMWHLNRLPQDRPESARAALSVFLQNDKNPNPTMSLGSAPSSNAPKRPRLIIPGSSSPQETPDEPEAQVPAPAPIALAPPPGNPSPPAPPPTSTSIPSPSESITTQQAPLTAQPEPAIAQPEPASEPAKAIPQPLTPPEGSKPSVHSAAAPIPQATPSPVVTPISAPLVNAGPRAKTQQQQQAAPSPAAKPAKQKLSNAAKTTIAAILGIVVVILGWYLLDRSGKNYETKRYNEMMKKIAAPDVSELVIDSRDLNILLRMAAHVSANENRVEISTALFLAKANDASDFDEIIAKFATETKEMLPEVRKSLIRDVIRKRNNPAVVPILMAYASKTDDANAAIAALEGIRFMADDKQFNDFLKIILTTSNQKVRKAAEDSLAVVIGKSSSHEELSERLASAYEEAKGDDVRHALLRLLGSSGGTKAMDLVRKALEGTESKDQIAALFALGAWRDVEAFSMITDFIAASTDESMRNRAFDAGLRFLTESEFARKADDTSAQWEALAKQAKTRIEQQKIIRNLTAVEADWSIEIIKGFVDSDHDEVADMAEKAVDFLEERKRIKGDNNETKDPEKEQDDEKDDESDKKSDEETDKDEPAEP
jgi:serine/threonine protein kinase